MSSLRLAIEEYLAFRRQLGFKLDRQKLLLREFASFTEDCGASFITTERALQWPCDPSGHIRRTWHSDSSRCVASPVTIVRRTPERRFLRLIFFPIVPVEPVRICIPRKTSSGC
jgi:hypothetical protein